MPKVERPKPEKPTCKACKNTGVNSKGGLCGPCVMNGRVKPPRIK